MPRDPSAPVHHLEFLDMLRGIAILAVFLYHAMLASFGFDSLPWSGVIQGFGSSPSFLLLSPLCLGFLGVPLFFVLSGFCIHLSHSRSRESDFKTFFARRFFRIYPPYLISLLVIALLPPFNFHLTILRTIDGWLNLGSHGALVHNLTDRYCYTVNGSFWSIAVEAQLYLLYPILWFFARKHGWLKALIASAIIELTFRLAVSINPAESFPQWFLTNPCAFWFSWCIGAATAESFLKRSLPRIPTSLLLVLGALLAGAYFFEFSSVFMFPLAAVLTSGIICKLVHRPLGPKGFLSKGLESLGVVSYSFYLIHQPIIGSVPKFLDKVFHVPVQPLISFAVCLASFVPIYWLSQQFYERIEQRSIQLGKKFILRAWGQEMPRKPSLVADRVNL